MSESATLIDAAILRPQDVRAAALESIPEDLDKIDDDGGITNVINAVTEMIQTHLGRVLFVDSDTSYFAAHQWWDSPHPSYAFQLYAPEWPFIEATDGNAVVADKARSGGQLLYCDSKLESLAAFYGYRRWDHSLADLQALAGLSTLTVLPDIYPYDIRDVCTSICLYIIQKRLAGSFGDQRVSQSISDSTFTVEATSSQYIKNQLARLDRHAVIL